MDKSCQELLEKVSKMGLAELKGLSSVAPFVFFYHQVSALPKLPICASPPVSPERFRSDLRLLTSLFKPLTVDEFLWHLRNAKPFPKGSFMMSFDDGLASCHSFAAPILEEFKLDGIFFLNTLALGNKALLSQHRTLLLSHVAGPEGMESVIKPRLAKAGFRVERLDQIFIALRGPSQELLTELEGEFGIDHTAWAAEHKPYLDEEQAEDLSKRGFLIGAHGRNHFRFREIPLELQLSEFAASVNFIAGRFKPKALAFAFPFTADDVGFSFFELASRLGTGVEAFFGTSAPLENPGMPWLIERLSVEAASDTESYLAELIRREIAGRLAGRGSVERK